MVVIGLLLGLINIGLGVYIMKHPHMIAGYNTMSEEKRKNVDIENIATIFKSGMIVIGITTIIGTTVFSILNLNTLALISLIAPMFIGILILIAITQKHDHNKKSRSKKIGLILFTIAILIIIAATFFTIQQGSVETKVIFNQNNIEFTGQYGLTIDREQIKRIELKDKLPKIELRTNGFSLGNILKGDFRVDSLGACCLFLHLPNPPYLYLELTNGKKIIFNSKTPQYTENVYNSLKE